MLRLVHFLGRPVYLKTVSTLPIFTDRMEQISLHTRFDDDMDGTELTFR